MNLRIVGSAGTDEKVEYLKSIGFDAAFNYKKGSIAENLGVYCPNGIDVYFDSVGGETLDAVLLHANNFARVVVCGMISQYNLEKSEPLYNTLLLIPRRIKMEGFVITDHMEIEPEFLKKVAPMLASGEIKYRYDVAYGIEKTPVALVNVLHGRNFGKQVVRIADL